MFQAVVVFFLCLFLIFFILRIVWLLRAIRNGRDEKTNAKKRYNRKKIKCMIVIGSGGHTSEMLRLLGAMRLDAYTPRHYVIADSDVISEEKVRLFERQAGTDDAEQNYEISYIPRSREVSQSWPSTVISTLHSSLKAFPIVFHSRPDLLLVNGPGTCIPVCVAAFLLTVFGRKVTITFAESLCRVTTLSLSGKILYYFADHLFVQWPELHELYPETQYMGRIV